jgi:transposase
MQPVFKEYSQGQGVLFPERLDDYIPESHVVRLVSTVVDKLDISSILSTYKGGGTSSYHPRMLLKVLFYAYLNNIFSSRKIEKALNENIYFMWLSGRQFPDFRTINNFRSSKLKNRIQEIFSSIVIMLAELGAVDISKVSFTDGTKIEANANRYTFVWRGSINYHKENLEKKLKKILNEINAQIKHDSEEENNDMFDGKTITKEEINKKIEELNKELANSSLSEKEQQKIGKKLSDIKEKDLARLQRYEESLEVMGENRNSYSKTDTDATFMRMKEDHMKNGQLKPAYNVQISTQNQIITNFGIYQNRTDYGTFISHLNQYYTNYQLYPSVSVADAGYGNEENYEFLEKHGIKNYVKYNWFHKEQKRKFKYDISNISNLYYNKEGDYFICPIGQRMSRVGTKHKTTDNGYKQEIAVYQAQNCQGCPLRSTCHSSKYNRKIYVNHNLIRHKNIAKANLLSDQGIDYRKQRSIEPESVFGQIKQDKGFRRFLLRGLDKVEAEFGLVAIAHNIMKMWKWMNHKQINIENIISFNNIASFNAIISKITSYYPAIPQEKKSFCIP